MELAASRPSAGSRGRLICKVRFAPVVAEPPRAICERIENLVWVACSELEDICERLENLEHLDQLDPSTLRIRFLVERLLDGNCDRGSVNGEVVALRRALEEDRK